MDREDIGLKFGPKLLEAVVCTQMKENNFIRQHLGLPLLNKGQAINDILIELEDTPDYDWMSKEL
jgi:hypothetical protein